MRAEKRVAQVADVKRGVGVRAGVLDDDALALVALRAAVLSAALVNSLKYVRINRSACLSVNSYLNDQLENATAIQAQVQKAAKSLNGLHNAGRNSGL